MVGRIIGNYRIEKLVGEGGMGRVYKARHVSLDRVAAVKALKSSVSASGKVRERLMLEQRILDRVRHTNIVSLYDIHVEGDEVFLVMEYVDGQTLVDLVADLGPLAPAFVGALGVQLLSALTAAHLQGVIHRDIKPGNIMLTATTAKLLDFGIAKAADEAGLTVAGMVMGSPPYLPPERWQSDPVTPATDIYALGLCLWESLAGRPAVPPELGVKGCYRAHTQSEIPDVRQARPDTPSWLAEAIFRATRMEPPERYADAAAMLPIFRQRLPPAAEFALPPPLLGPPAGGTEENKPTVFFRRAPAVKATSGERAPALRSDRGSRLIAPDEFVEARHDSPLPIGNMPSTDVPVPSAGHSGTPEQAGEKGTRGEGGPSPRAVQGTWKPGQRTMAYIRQKTRPWKWIGAGLVGAGASVAIGLAVFGWFVSNRQGITFAVEVANVADSPVRVSCGAGEGRSRRAWEIEVAAKQTSSITISALPADCYDVAADGTRTLIWAMPKLVSLGGVDAVEEAATEQVDLRPPEALAEVEPKPAPTTKGPGGKRTKKSISRVFVGEAPEPLTSTDACQEFPALEPHAMLGTLQPEQLACLEGIVGSERAITVKDKASRLLLWNAEARKDDVDLERLLRRHIDSIDRSDPMICLSLARICSRKQDDGDLQQAIRYASMALESKERIPTAEHANKVMDLMRLRSRAALLLYQHANDEYVRTHTAAAEAQAESRRGVAKNYAREWYDFALAANADPTQARDICQSAAGTRSFCP